MVQYQMRLGVLFLCAELCRSHFPCLTWEIRQNKLHFIYRVIDFSKSIALIDSEGQIFADCEFTGNVHSCSPVEKKHLIEVDYSRKYIAFTTATLDETMNGKWSCIQGEHRITTKVSLSKGIANSTEILLTTRLLSTTSHHAKHALNCFSCRKPDDENVEFLMNDRTEDSISYNPNTSKCINHKGECHPEECKCTENMFMRVFELDFSNIAIFTCEFLFTDSSNQAKFSKHASVLFDGKAYYNKPITTSIIRAADKSWNGIYTVSVDHIDNPTDFSTTRVIETLVKNQDEDSIRHVHMIINVSLLVILSAFVLLIVLFLRKKKNTNTEITQEMANIEVYSSSPLQQEQNLNSQTISRTVDLSLCDPDSSQTDQSDEKSSSLLPAHIETENPKSDNVMKQANYQIFNSETTMRRNISLTKKQ